MEIKRIISKILDSNTFVISKGDKAIIIDAGAKLEDVKNEINNKKVLGIFLTHAHYDHVFYCLDYAKEFDCKIYANKNSPEYFLDSDKNYGEGFKIEDVLSFIFIEGENDIELENFAVHYICCGGHSKTDTLYLIENDLFVGDSLIGRSVGRMDLYGGNKFSTLRTLEILKNLEYKTMHCGHGEDCDKQEQDKVVKTWIKFLGDR
ncbi:MAG: MBL fold metallo-hydrolase [Clostridia bacterium]|nr:MBL fold metallo-hydrolase [Clostridia bacterium]